MSLSNLQRVLESGEFAVTGELGPPMGADADAVRAKAKLLADSCDAYNVTDNQTAIVRLSSMAGCVLLREVGVEPIMQMVVRDRNRIALQSDILGAVALGIGNILCISGDHQKFGNHPSARGVFDVDSVQLIQVLKNMRDDHHFISGEDISGDVPVFIGAVENPFADPYESRVPRLAKKIKAGADFIQTQAVFDVPKFAEWMEQVAARGLDRETHILAGVIPVKSAGMARYMRDYVSGVAVPDSVVQRMEQAENPKDEGVNITAEIIEELKEITAVHGIHIMAVGWEDMVPEIVKRAGLLPRPVL